MAMRPRRSNFRTQPSLRPANEAFQPKSEMKENQEAFILQIQLPGFTKERLRIQCEESARTVKVSGERPIDGGKRWNRFKQEYHIPENCEAARIQSKFSQGILTITMPKKLISQAAPKAPSPPKKAGKVPDFIPPEPAITARVEEPRDKKNASSPSTPSSVRTFDDLNALNGQEDTPAQRPFDSQEPAEKGLRPMKPSELIWAEKGQGEILQKSKMTMEADPKKKTDGARRELAKEDEHSAPKKEKVTTGTAAAAVNDVKHNDATIDTIGKGIKEVAASAFQAYTKIAEGKWEVEDKPLLVNMGASVLVIAALGAYLYSRFASSGRT